MTPAPTARPGLEGRLRTRWRRLDRGRSRHDGETPYKKEPVAAFLVIPYGDADIGERPIEDPEVFYRSPNIWITGGDAFGNPIEGRPARIHARIWNHGNCPALAARVRFFVVDPALGIPFGAPKRVGTDFVNVPPHGTEEAICPQEWTFGPATSASHPCLIVTCESQPLDPPVAPGDVRNDRKTAQRNLTVVAAAPNQFLTLVVSIARTLRTRGPLEVFAFATRALPRRRVEGQNLPLRHALDALGRRADDRLKPLVRRAKALAQLDTAVEIVPARELASFVRFAADAKQLDRADGGALRQAFGAGLLPLGAFAVEPLVQHDAKLEVAVPEVERTLTIHLFQVEDGTVTGGYALEIRPERR